MSKKPLHGQIDALPVYDTHTHLRGECLGAQDFWDIGHYFWFVRELEAAGYPTDAMSLPPAKRISAFWSAWQQTQNTSMTWVVRRILSDLYGVVLKSESDIRKADEAIRAAAESESWAAEVCARANIQKIVTNVPGDLPFPGIESIGRTIPRPERQIRDWISRAVLAGDQQAEMEAIKSEISSTVQKLKTAGHTGIMFSNGPFDRLAARTHGSGELSRTQNTRDDIGVAVLHALSQSCETNGMFIQFFLGIEHGWGSEGGGGGVPAYDPNRILNLHGLFKRYDIPFELVLGDGIGNSDAVNAARCFPNVHVGGLWWYNFRASIYRQIMQQRFEALPSIKSSIVASDARCIEWCYGKIVLIKRLLADYLQDQVDQGWIDRDGAIKIGRDWLHDSAEALYE
jgi:hypothetical protein